MRDGYGQARQVLNGLAAVGVDYDDVVGALEADGVAKFQSSWTELLGSVEAVMTGNRPTVGEQR